MPTEYKYIPQHKDGHYLDRVAQPTDNYMQAMRWGRKDDLEHWLTTRHCPDAPNKFRIRRLRADWELEVEEHEPTQPLAEDRTGTEGS